MDSNTQFQTEAQVLASPFQRFLAAFIDGILISAIGFVPVLGWVLGPVYSLTKDALPFLEGQSIGKKAMGLRVVKVETGDPITGDYATAAIRAISLWIPLFNIVDALMVFRSDRLRFGDQWAKTKVILVKK